MSRRGFTLTEVILALSMLGVLGLILSRVMINDSRFVSREDAMMAARQSARAAMHTVTAELRAVEADPIAATRDSVRLRIPFAFGLVCRSTGGVTIATLLPVDSLTFAFDTAGGGIRLRWRQMDGTYIGTSSTYTVTNSANAAACVSGSDSIKVVPGGRRIALSPDIPSAGFGAIFYLYQRITFLFANSQDPSLTGRRALFRRNGAGVLEELIAPFDTSARFRCLTGPGLAPVDCPPAGGLSTVRGLELRLKTASTVRPQGTSGYMTFDLTARLPFTNKVSY